jgi:hypothetical protein
MKVIDMLNVLVNEQTTFGYIKYYDRRNKKYEIMLNCEENIINKLDEGNITLYDEIEGIVEHEEEPQEHKIPEKLISTSLRGIDNLDEKIEVAHVDTISAIDKINEILDYLEVNNG